MITPALDLAPPAADGNTARFGTSVASAGAGHDVNGDGFADVIVGAEGVNDFSGRVHVYLGSASGLMSTPTVDLEANEGAYSVFGHSVASAGDINGDGFADVIVGAGDPGHVYVYLGSGSALSSTPAFILAPPGADGTHPCFGCSIASAGDIDGDGFADVIVGAPTAYGKAGRVHVYLGGGSGLTSTPALDLASPAGGSIEAFFGSSVASAGDINGDGFVDVIVAAEGKFGEAGHVYVYLGSTSGLTSTPALDLDSPAADGSQAFFGRPVASAGDINGDGFADVIIGAYRAYGTSGRVHVYFGDASKLLSTPPFDLAPTSDALPGAYGAFFGTSLASAAENAVVGPRMRTLVGTASASLSSSRGACGSRMSSLRGLGTGANKVTFLSVACLIASCCA